MNIKDSLDKLFSLHNFGVKLGLENITKFLKILNDPQNDLKTIHIAGSNGKGSTSAFISSILQEHKFKVGLYTSPHFVKFNERININGNEIEDEYIVDFISKHFEYIEENQVTFFEVTTAMAFCYFRDQKVDYAVIETGLGGRLDATNVLNPLCSVITSISLEHTKILGDTIEKIAAEKAGIIKPESKVLIGLLPVQATKVITSKCSSINTKCIQIENYISNKKRNILINFDNNRLAIKELPLPGIYQKQNAALASLTVMSIVINYGTKLIESGLANVVQNTSLSGRYEFYNKKPDIIFDSAHNPDGITKFLSEFSRHSKKYKKKYLLYSSLNDKDYKSMLKTLRKEFENIYLTKINYERSANIEELVYAAKELSFNVKVSTDNNLLIK
ncbi:MAG: hypothetical protein COW08_00255, partial [Ignavibacteriales bacterium CG12_big_fil_rev_8_21_14_0_65_30_8]